MSSHAFTAALAHMQAGQWAQARARLQQVLRSKPRDHRAAAAMALACFRDGQPAQADFYLGVARRSDPDAQTLNNLGRLLTDMGRYDDAEAALRDALHLQPGHPDAALNLAYVLSALSRYAAAERALREALAHHPDDPRLLDALAYAVLQSGRAEEALGIIERAAAIDPHNPVVAFTEAFAKVYAPGVSPANQRAALERHGRLLAGGAAPLPPPPRARAARCASGSSPATSATTRCSSSSAPSSPTWIATASK